MTARRLYARGPRAIALALACALPLAGCSLLNPANPTTTPTTTGVTTQPSPSASPSSSPSASPSATPSATPSVTPTAEPTGPITGAPAGAPVKPEVFLATVDTANGNLRVVADVPGIYENGGLCTVKVTHGSTSLQQHSTGAADATSTACGLFTFALADLPSGTATIVVSYQSDAHTGSSDPYSVTIP